MKKIGTYTFYSESTKEEIELTKSIFKGVDLNNEKQLFNITESILTQPFNKQLEIIHCAIDTMYDLSRPVENLFFENFLSQEKFNTHRDIIITIVDDDISESEKKEKLTEYENMFNINIIDSGE